jgi:hypothetical protein
VRQLWEARFRVGPGEECRWNFKASSEREAREIAESNFRNAPHWAARYPVTPPVELRMVPRAAASNPHGDVGPFDVDSDGSVREGDSLSVPCPDCGGTLRADRHFVLWSRSGDSPETREPFWSTTCRACGHRFNYMTGSGEIRRFEP